MADWKEVKEIKFVVAVDESEESMYALSWCLNNLVPNQGHCTIFLLHAQPPPPVLSSLDGTGYVFSGNVLANIEKYNQELTARAMERAKMICKNLNSQIKVEKVVWKGDARDVICSMLDKFGADLAVMGSHGYGFVERALLGSVMITVPRKPSAPSSWLKVQKLSHERLQLEP